MLMFGEQAGLHLADAEGEYVSVDLRLFPPDAAGTPVELTVSGVRRDFPRVHVPLVPDALGALAGAPQRYGEALGRQLFEGTELGSQFAEVRTALDASGARWRLRLRLEDPTLQALRWERLCEPSNGNWAPVGSTADRPFSRYVPVNDWKVATPMTGRPIPVLLVYSSPANLGALQLAQIPPAERDAIRAALMEVVGGQIQIEELATDGPERPTLANLREALTRAPAIVHILCHGTAGAAGSALILEREDGSAQAVDAATLRDVVRGAATPPRLVVLSACESATAGAGGFMSLGGQLATDSVDAVLAMTEAVSIQTARAFCRHFYERLFAHGVVDRAVNEGRAAVRGALDWGVPVLFARMRDCQLLDFGAARVDAAYLGISNRVVRAAAAARDFGERKQAAHDVLAAMSGLINELEKSHRLLTGVTGDFRRTGSDPATFAATFEAFRYRFKDYYDTATWQQERTHCHEVEARAQPVMALFKDALSESDFEQLGADIRALSRADGEIIEQLGVFLDRMNEEVDAITKLVRAADVAGAIQRKLTFEDEISPTFRRSKELLAEISARSHAVQAA